jgi:hypothetical protein
VQIFDTVLSSLKLLKFSEQFYEIMDMYQGEIHHSPKSSYSMIDAAKALVQRVVRLALVPGWMRGCEARL